MSRTFTKLFSSITESTVWCEPHATVRVWIAMLAKADHVGRVFASIPGLANLARVTIEECEVAITTFLSPDKYSRTPDFEGRRIEPIDGGWRLLNHAKYRALRDEESARESKRNYINGRRAKERAEAQGVENVEHSRSASTQAEADTEAEADTSEAKATVQPAAAPRTASRFAEFWKGYPNKQGKQDAERKWKAKKLDLIADQIIAHVARMLREDEGWREGYIPMGSTYINGGRWEDEPRRTAAPGQVTAPAPKPESFGAAAAFKPSESKDEQRRAWEANQRALGFDPATGKRLEEAHV